MKHLLLTTIAAVVLVGCSKPPPPNISIHHAAVHGNIEAIKQHLAAGTDVDAKDAIGWTPLHVVADNGRKEIAELLIAKGASVNTQAALGLTPLDLAIRFRSNRTEMADLLRKHGGKTGEELKAAEPVVEAAKTEPPTAKVPTIPLRIAVGAGNIVAVKQHLAAGTNVNAKRNGTTPLHSAAFNGHKEIAELLIAKGADVNVLNAGGYTPLDLANNNPEIADLLRKHGGKTAEELNVLFDAAKKGDTEAVKQHLAAGADVNAKTDNGMTPLHDAAYRGHKEIAELLIDKGADVNSKDKYGTTPLHMAASNGDKEIAELLINNGADVNAKVLSGKFKEKTPLDLAIRFKRPETADLLRKHGGKTADWLKAEDSIHIAAKAGHIEAVKKHLADGAGVNAIGKFRKASPLYMAAYSYNAEATKFLLENGADVDQLDFEKETALHTAAYHSYHGEGDVSVVALLVDRGSKINAISDRGLTPLDLAIMAGTPEVSDLLRKHGGKTREELKAEGK
jgi:cytohesin